MLSSKRVTASRSWFDISRSTRFHVRIPAHTQETTMIYNILFHIRNYQSVEED